MVPYQYLKAPPKGPGIKVKLSNVKSKLTILPYIMMLGGITLLSYVVYPIASHQWRVYRRNRIVQTKTPHPTNKQITPEPESQKLALDNKSKKSETKGVVFGEETSINDVESWFPAAAPQRVAPSRVTHYNISIPELNIKDAIVTIAGEDLMDSLIHYGGTALPGEYGDSVIFGHSVLPTFYDPKDYQSIFSLIPTLEEGDEIVVDFDGIQFLYQVQRYYEVSPEQIDILRQNYSNRCLRLVTCVPPGTYLRRGIIEACLVSR